MRGWLLLLLFAASVARAESFFVQKAPLDLLHAERLDITERFELVRVELSVALVGSTRLTGVELTEVMTPAGTYVSRGHWTYAITLRERGPDEIPEGIFDVILESNGRALDAVRLMQALPNPLVAEGARVVFDLGFALPPAQLFVVSVREVPVGAVIGLTSAVAPDLDYVWRDAAQNENPTVAAALGEVTTFVIENGDGTSLHNLQILDGTEPPPQSEDVVELGDQATLQWQPPSAGSFVYQCQYHPTMSGIIEVTA